ncbi:hypothetical protein FB45DRAFT_900610 [Roridomyces roridus]|uniref:Uncharacterized protein n=1 Tax=Roridomyces roridus TaxID=1738132 RepID=A0AAD7C896_9AGAR|nr:hypothetical protein FB45DRAFT_900610 [Roridomyces roridus]
MSDITIIPANLVTLILESFLYGIVLLLFISTIYFLASRRTLAGKSQTATHHFASLAFIGVTALFLVVTVHWTLVTYQAFLAFIHLGDKAGEDTFYADLSQLIEVAKVALFSVTILIGDSLVAYRLWIVWSRGRMVIIFPMVALLGVLV